MLHFYFNFIAGRGVKYCDECHASLSVCLLANLENYVAELNQIF